MLFSHLLIFFKINFLKKMPNGVSNSLDPDHARHFVGPDRAPNFCKGYQQATLGGRSSLFLMTSDSTKQYSNSQILQNIYFINFLYSNNIIICFFTRQVKLAAHTRLVFNSLYAG